MQIRFKTPQLVGSHVYGPDEVADVPDARAEQLVKGGFAEPAAGPAPEAAEPADAPESTVTQEAAEIAQEMQAPNTAVRPAKPKAKK